MMRYETDVPTYTCPWCWETVSAVVDCSQLPLEVIEDCEVCCRPARLIDREDGEGLIVEAVASD
jgi:hypothetical protein